MPVKDLLKRKSALNLSTSSSPNVTRPRADTEPGPNYDTEHKAPEFVFVRTTTLDQEIIQPPSYPGDDLESQQQAGGHAHGSPHKKWGISHKDREEEGHGKDSPEKEKSKRHSIFKRTASSSSQRSTRAGALSTIEADSDEQPDASDSQPSLSPRPSMHRKLSERLRLRTLSRTSSLRSVDSLSANLPEDLGEAPDTIPAPNQPNLPKPKEADPSTLVEKQETAAREAEWEARATKLALRHKPSMQSLPTTPEASEPPRPSTADASISDEEKLQLAIALHESGSLAQSTTLFGALADNPSSPNNALACVLYGLSLRHGWGIDPNPSLGLTYLQRAATASASIEAAALTTTSKPGSAKGELVLAIFELANCFRYGWGVDKDPVGARAYYETAANLGDLDACEEVAWCWSSGFGGEKNRWRAAQYLRRAERGGRKLVGESWIWKAKYDPDSAEGVKVKEKERAKAEKEKEKGKNK